MKQLALINPENATESEVSNYSTREAVRAVVFDSENNVALLHVSNEKYYKLPGGGIEGDEDHASALKRECVEEIGADVEIIGEIGSIVEYRKMFSLKQTSYCYLAKVVGVRGEPNYTQEELEGGFKLLWAPFDEALSLLQNNIATSIEGGKYIVPRDLIFLQQAKQQ
jgi:8-oxo-dGTP diphosphatase